MHQYSSSNKNGICTHCLIRVEAEQVRDTHRYIFSNAKLHFQHIVNFPSAKSKLPFDYNVTLGALPTKPSTYAEPKALSFLKKKSFQN